MKCFKASVFGALSKSRRSTKLFREEVITGFYVYASNANYAVEYAAVYIMHVDSAYNYRRN